ncbi:MAG: hypothetical protein ABSC54_10365 [Smithellaceae bacterium]
MKRDNRVLISAIAILVAIAVTIAVLISKCYKANIINWGLFIATGALATIAYIQLNALLKQMNVDFLFRFNREFFGSEINQKIIAAVEEKKKILKENGGEFTAYQIDDYLGYFELMSHYEKRGFMDFELIDETFGHYISLIWQNEEIGKYIDELRDETNDPRYYEPFKKLAIRIIKEENEVRQTKK